MAAARLKMFHYAAKTQWFDPTLFEQCNGFLIERIEWNIPVTHCIHTVARAVFSPVDCSGKKFVRHDDWPVELGVPFDLLGEYQPIHGRSLVVSLLYSESIQTNECPALREGSSVLMM
mmetsp:Transcript_4564/g.6926  ORF Transcript_4564/g.6926 Transcript_4564/m.6926 type:complete len:118 (+) Transcript_4564:2088-2441(+)